MNNELVALNDTSVKKFGTLPGNLANGIFSTLKDLSNMDIKEILAEVESDIMLNRLFTTAFSRNETQICIVLFEILEERKIANPYS